MQGQVKISICIPAYKRVEFLERLLQSIVSQTFRDFEVIVTDDSPDERVKEVCTRYAKEFLLHYYKNTQPLGTPENWNEAIRHATGEWVKLMHDDDWFASNESLNEFAKATVKYEFSDFIFSAYRNVRGADISETVKPEYIRWRKMLKDPETLISKNIIGPPSVVLHKNDRNLFYDGNLRWLVDIDFYIRCLRKGKPVFIDKALIFIGINEYQVTKTSSLSQEIEIPENFYLLNKIGFRQLNNIYIYDAWWRLLRNLKIRTITEIYASGYSGPIPPQIRSILNFQRPFPYSFLKMGILSKILMIISFVFINGLIMVKKNVL